MEFKNNDGTKKQKRTYGPMGLSELRLRALIQDNEQTLVTMGQVCEALVDFYEQHKDYVCSTWGVTWKRILTMTSTSLITTTTRDQALSLTSF